LFVANDAHLATVSQYIVEGVSDVAALLYPDAWQPVAAMEPAMSPTLEVSIATP
jgi:hypothetical protein